MRIIRAREYRRMPWKNGGGETREIAVLPEGAGLEEFDWRISMARVAADGPFSTFPGVDRTLAVLEGNGLRLTVNQQRPVELLPSSPPFNFPGDAPAGATLVRGEIVDFNVMTRRGRWRQNVTRLRLGTAVDLNSRQLDCSAPRALVFCQSGAARVQSRHQVLRISRSDSLLLTTAARSGSRETIALQPEAASTLLFVELWPV